MPYRIPIADPYAKAMDSAPHAIIIIQIPNSSLFTPLPLLTSPHLTSLHYPPFPSLWRFRYCGSYRNGTVCLARSLVHVPP